MNEAICQFRVNLWRRIQVGSFSNETFVVRSVAEGVQLYIHNANNSND